MQQLNGEIIKGLTRFDAPTIANAIEFFDVRDATEGYASLELHCMFPELRPVVGYAVTCTADSTSPGKNRPSVDKLFYEAIRDAPKPVIVVMKDASPDRLRSCHAGDMMATLFQKLGAVALITDGGVRDLEGVQKRAPGFQMFAGGLVTAHGMPTIVEVGMTVSICGLTIRPGDLLHGDYNGVVKIPPSIAERLAEQAEAVWRDEACFVDYVKNPGFTLDEMAARFGWW